MTRRIKWPKDAEETREDAIATALDTRTKLREAMELLNQGRAIPVAIAIHKASIRNEKVIEILRETKEG